ncbi:hypothetical protein ABBQ32_013886 [Trebouxia sp. C0010 RCD-2024]
MPSGMHIRLRHTRLCLLLESRKPRTVQRNHFFRRVRALAHCCQQQGCMADAHSTPSQALDFLTLLQNLKKTKRTGWVRKGILGPESIADHMYRMSMMAFISNDSAVDSNRCIKLAIVHDVAEAIVGDIAPSDNVTKEVKNQLETEAMCKIRDMLGHNTAAGEEIEALWQEYEDGKSPEALMVKDFDKLEMILQAQEYEREQEVDLQDFFDSTEGRFATPLGQAWAKEIIKRRAGKGNRAKNVT